MEANSDNVETLHGAMRTSPDPLTSPKPRFDFDSPSRVEEVEPPSQPPSMDNDAFQWPKPPAMDVTALSATARLAQAVAMETKMRQREVMLRLVCKQLRKANQERFQLLQELEGYRGSAREALYRENLILRERIDRVTRENLKLRAQALHEKKRSGKRKI